MESIELKGGLDSKLQTISTCFIEIFSILEIIPKTAKCSSLHLDTAHELAYVGARVLVRVPFVFRKRIASKDERFDLECPVYGHIYQHVVELMIEKLEHLSTLKFDFPVRKASFVACHNQRHSQYREW